MSFQDPNLRLLMATAHALTPLLDEVVFVGGSITGLLITDPAALPIRVTKDVDIVAEIGSPVGYYDMGRRLEKLGFEPDRTPGVPICRWRKGELLLDLMSTESSALGFTNPWYREGIQSAEWRDLPDGTRIRMLSAPVYLLTKWEAFQSRGGGDYLESHDIEDLVAVLDGRPSIEADIAAANGVLRQALAEVATLMRSDPTFLGLALPGLLGPYGGGSERAALLEAILFRIGNAGPP